MALQAAGKKLAAHHTMLFSQERPLEAFIDSYLSEWRIHRPIKAAANHHVCRTRTARPEPPTIDAVLSARVRQIETALGDANADEQSLMMMSAPSGRASVDKPELATRILHVVRESMETQASGKHTETKKAGQ